MMRVPLLLPLLLCILPYCDAQATGITVSTPAAGPGLVLSTMPVIKLVDAGGAAVTGFTDNVVVTQASGPGSLTNTGATAAISTSTGLASFAGGLAFTVPGTYSLLFTVTLTGAQSNTFTVTQSGIVVTVAPAAKHVTAVIDQSVTLSTDLPFIVITLLPYSTDSTASLTAKISQLPSSGTLFNLSPNYSKYGYTPLKGTQITAAGTVVSDSLHRLLYEGPLGFTKTFFQYQAETTSGGAALTSATEGTVAVTLTDRVFLSSYFYETNEAWQQVSASSTPATWSATRTGGLNFYIYGDGGGLVLGADNTQRWYFAAPSSWYDSSNGDGQLAPLYNGQLQFWMGPLAGDFTTEALQYSNPKKFVEIRCRTCNNGKGVYLAQREVQWRGGIEQFTFTLNENSGWLKDPQDSRVTMWPKPTACEFVEVLSNVSSVRIYGDVTSEYEVVAIDDVALMTGSLDSIPNACY